MTDVIFKHRIDFNLLTSSEKQVPYLLKTSQNTVRDTRSVGFTAYKEKL